MKARLRKKWQVVPCVHKETVSCGEGYYEFFCKLNGHECMFSDCKHFKVAKCDMRWNYICEKDVKRHPIKCDKCGLPFDLFNL